MIRLFKSKDNEKHTHIAKPVKKVLIAGGLCGTTMLMAAEKIEDACRKQKIYVNVKVHNLWESQYAGEGFDVIIEMFKFFEDQKCPVFDGKPFINHIGTKELVNKIVGALDTVNTAC